MEERNHTTHGSNSSSVEDSDKKVSQRSQLNDEFEVNSSEKQKDINFREEEDKAAASLNQEYSISASAAVDESQEDFQEGEEEARKYVLILLDTKLDSSKDLLESLQYPLHKLSGQEELLEKMVGFQSFSDLQTQRLQEALNMCKIHKNIFRITRWITETEISIMEDIKGVEGSIELDLLHTHLMCVEKYHTDRLTVVKELSAAMCGTDQLIESIQKVKEEEEEEDKAASAYQETGSSGCSSNSATIDEMTSLEIYNLLNSLIHAVITGVSSSIIFSVEKTLAMIYFWSHYCACQSRNRKLETELEVCTLQRKTLEDMVSDDTLHKGTILELLSKCSLYEHLLSLVNNVTQNELWVMQSILYKNTTEQGLLELHNTHQILMRIKNGLMNQVNSIKEQFYEKLGR